MADAGSSPRWGSVAGCKLGIFSPHCADSYRMLFIQAGGKILPVLKQLPDMSETIKCYLVSSYFGDGLIFSDNFIFFLLLLFVLFLVTERLLAFLCYWRNVLMNFWLHGDGKHYSAIRKTQFPVPLWKSYAFAVSLVVTVFGNLKQPPVSHCWSW